MLPADVHVPGLVHPKPYFVGHTMPPADAVVVDEGALFCTFPETEFRHDWVEQYEPFPP